MTPPDPQSMPAEAPMTGPVMVPRRDYRWYHKLMAVVFISVCLEVGLFLLIFPWTEYWAGNFFASLIPEWNRYWENMYARGAISGLGVIDLYISFVEILRLRRFAKH
jgi:hypothetical protein